MAVRLVVFREKNWFDKRTEHRMFDHLARAYGAELAFLPHGGVVPNALPGTLVLVDEEGVTEISNFEHPVDATYVFGRSGQRLLPGPPGSRSVRIATPEPVSLFGISAAAIVLRDRGG